MVKKILLVVALLIAGLLIYAATLPSDFRVQRTATIDAPPATVFPLVDDLHAWDRWSPWDKLDPAMKRTHSGAERGKGAVYEWEGNSDVGKGRMEVLESTPPSKVVIRLDFLEPFAATNTTELTFAPKGEGTEVTWTMYGPMPYLSKVMSIFMSMDSMIGKDFEAGLANLKAAAEKPE